MTIKDLIPKTFTKCHDAIDPMRLIFSSYGVRVGLVTDVGRGTRLVEDHLRDCHTLIIKFSHDPRMLEDGPYPLDLKKRIKGSEGHFSNRQAGQLLEAIAHEDLRRVIPAHLSETNNQTQKARQESQDILERCGLSRPKTLASHQDYPICMLKLG